MKYTNKVKISLCFLLSMLMTGCHEFTPTTSHYGTGNYRCYYHDVRNGQLYLGVASTQKEAAIAARRACLDAPPAKDLEHQYCEFAECLFK